MKVSSQGVSEYLNSHDKKLSINNHCYGRRILNNSYE